MNKILLVTLVVTLVCINASDVIEVTQSNFQKVVLQNSLPVMVKFYAPWCGHCKNLAPTWEKVATNLAGIVPIAKVDCTVHQNLCSQYGIQGYPTIKAFYNGKATDYQSGRDARSISDFATKMLENFVFKLNAASEDKFWEKKPELPHVILFSNKGDVTPLTKSLAIRFKNNAVFGQVKGDDGAIGSRYGVDSFPKLIIVKGKDDANPVVFEGTISPDALEKFIRENVGGASSGSGNAGEEKKEEAPAPRVKKPKIISALDKASCETLQEQCKDKICAIGFVDAKENIDEQQKSTLDALVEKFKADGAFTFLYVDRNCPTWVEKFSLPDAPSFVVYNERRGRYISTPDFSLTTIIPTLERVLTGDAQYNKLL